ncbi:50S ribosomal protein L13 [Candidatus Woesebacteria bacterium]|nr:50S ribosomal protein L13 [Candidatus Woesebacteria bacterium]
MTHVTTSTRPISEKEIDRSWHLVDAKGQTLGRIIPEITQKLQGKHKTSYVPYLDMGDNVVVINAAHVAVTGKKEDNKTYKYYSGYPGGLKEVSYKHMKQHKPEEIIRHAVSGMLPKNKHKDSRLARLFIYPDENNKQSKHFS